MKGLKQLNAEIVQFTGLTCFKDILSLFYFI